VPTCELPDVTVQPKAGSKHQARSIKSFVIFVTFVVFVPERDAVARRA
jgi:hypothetical protein